MQRLRADVKSDLQAVGYAMSAFDEQRGSRPGAEIAHRFFKQSQPSLEVSSFQLEIVMRGMRPTGIATGFQRDR